MKYNTPFFFLLAVSTIIFATTQASTSFPIAPRGHHLYLQHRPPPNALALPPVARRQMETLPTMEREPTCQELRSMWRHMRRMGRQMEFTNEIPKIQDPFTASAVRFGASRRRPSKYPDPNPYSMAKSNVASKEAMYHAQGKFGAVIKDQNEVMVPVADRIVMDVNNMPDSLGFHEFDDSYTQKVVGGGRGRMVPGRFADTSLPEEALGGYGTVVNSPEERARFRAKSRRPQSFSEIKGFRGVPWSDSTGLGRVPFRATQPHSPQYHYGSVVTHAERHPLGGFAEFPQEIGQRGGAVARVERIDKIGMNGKFGQVGLSNGRLDKIGMNGKFDKMGVNGRIDEIGMNNGRLDKIGMNGKLQNTCLRLQSRTCQTDVDCFCNGNPKLFCGGGRCRPLFKATKYGKQQKWSKNWLTDSYERSLLGYAPKRDPVWPGPF